MIEDGKEITDVENSWSLGVEKTIFSYFSSALLLFNIPFLVHKNICELKYSGG